MMKAVEKYKGIHPGAVLERELKKRKLAKRPFALSIAVHPQSLNAITKGKRGMNTVLAMKIEEALDLEEGTLMTLQVYYDIKVEKQKRSSSKRPELANIRTILFWDTDFSKINWEKHDKYVIQRVFERGNQDEKNEILKFYGEEKIKEITGSITIPKENTLVMPHLKNE